MDPSPRSQTQSTDERFYTPRAQISTGRSTQSFGTPRTSRSSETSSSEYGTTANTRYDSSTVPSTRSIQFVPDHQPQRFGSYDSSVQQFHQSRRGSMIPPQYPTKLSSPSPEYKDGGFYNDSDIDDVESQGARDYVSGHGYSEEDVKNIFSYTRHGRVEEVDSLLLRGVPVDVRDENGNTVLLVSCQNGNKRLVKLALRYGADINLCNFKGNTALHFCCRYGYARTLGNYLRRKGADDNIRNLCGETCDDLGGTER